jgi:hypothetical protein
MGEYVSSYHDIYEYDFSVLSHFTQIIVATSSAEEMAVVPRPGLGGGLESMSFRIERTDICGFDEGSPRATTRRSRRGNRSNVGKNSSGGWHCWLDCWWVKEGGMRGTNSR